MKYRPLGKTGLSVSEIGYGTWQFANDDECWVGATREESEQSLLTAIDSGLNFIDTARSYGDGRAEEWIGEIIKKRADKEIIIASKIPPKNWQWPARSGTSMSETFPGDYIVSEVEKSLKTLQVESLDIMFFHVWLDEWVNIEEWQKVTSDLTKQGKVRFWGISTNNFESTNCIKACDTGLITVVETIFNLFNQEAKGSLFPYARANNIGLITRVPLDEGGLTGTINSKTVFEDGDFRKNYFTKDRLIELDKRVDELKTIVANSNEVESLPEMALRFILNFPEVSAVIPGMRKLKHVKDNIALSDKDLLSNDLMGELKKHAWNRNFYGHNSWED